MRRAHSSGFTVIELLIVIVFFAAVTVLFLVQKNNLSVAARDSQRKTAINAMYYNLEEVFYAKNGYYPEKIDSNNLTAMDPALFIDPENTKLGDTTTDEAGSTHQSDYRYAATNCVDGKCKSYELRAQLEHEEDYVKKSRHS